MKAGTAVLALIALVFLAGCASMTPTQKKVAWIAAGVVVSSVAVSALDDSPQTYPPCQSFHWSYSTQINTWICQP